jgi:hypothetical protein
VRRSHRRRRNVGETNVELSPQVRFAFIVLPMPHYQVLFDHDFTVDGGQTSVTPPLPGRGLGSEDSRA